MKLTDEQLQEIADKGAEAAHQVNTADSMLCIYGASAFYETQAPARQTFARTVIDLALSKMAEGEGDLFRSDEIRKLGYTLSWGQIEVMVNTRHRQEMAALRAQMQREIDALADWKAQAMRVESEWDEQALAKQLGGQLGESCRKVIQKVVPFLVAENSELKEALSLLDNVYGSPGSTPKTLCEDVLKVIEVQKQRAEAAEKELAALKQQAPADGEAFEKWAEPLLKSNLPYTYAHLWQSWQAAIAHKQPPQSNRVEYCYICGVPTDDWVDPSWSKGRVCRDCESKHEPTAPTAEKVPAPQAVEISLGPDGFAEAHEKPNTPPLVTFTNGKINPPPYGSWHRSDWTPEMLPDGWRPLLLSEREQREDELSWDKERWHKGPVDDGTGAQPVDYHRRTRRPLPPAPEKEKEPGPATLHGWTKAPPLTLHGEVRMRVEWLADYLSVQRTDYERKHALNSTLVGLEGVLTEASKPKP